MLRIVYDGLATAGKTANLRSLHSILTERVNGELCSPEQTPTGRTPYFDWLELRVGFLEAWPLRCQILTVPGQLALAERRFRVLREIDAAVLVCESTERGAQAGRIAATFLTHVLACTGNEGAPILVQANKQDLAAALPPEEVKSRLGLTASCRVVPASALLGDGVLATFLGALGEAKERLRRTLEDRDPASLPAHMASAEELFASMLAEEEAPPDPRIPPALDALLDAANER